MPDERNVSFWRHQFPAIAWAGVIFILSSLPGAFFTIPTRLPVDKAFHAGIFFIFCLLLNRAFINQTRLLTLSRYRLLISFLIVVAYGISDEFHQTFVPGRTPDFADALADSIGGLLGILYLFFLTRFRSMQEAKSV